MNGDPSSSSSTQQMMVPLQDSFMNSRAEALQIVESTIHELSNIFTQFAPMVSQQGELAIRFLTYIIFVHENELNQRHRSPQTFMCSYICIYVSGLMKIWMTH